MISVFRRAFLPCSQKAGGKINQGTDEENQVNQYKQQILVKDPTVKRKIIQL